MIEKDAIQFFYDMDDIFYQANLKYIPFLGTLLGAIRENRFIPIDKDLDLAVLHEDFVNKAGILLSLFIKNKFKAGYKHHKNPKIKENNPITGIYIAKYNIHGDICCLFKIKNYRYYPRTQCVIIDKNTKQPKTIYNETLVYKSEDIENLKQIKFYNRTINVPINSEKILEETYGKDWRIPHTKFQGTKFTDFPCGKLPKGEDELWWAE